MRVGERCGCVCVCEAGRLLEESPLALDCSLPLLLLQPPPLLLQLPPLLRRFILPDRPRASTAVPKEPM